MARHRSKRASIAIHTFFAVFSLTFVIPFLLVAAASLTDEQELQSGGYTLFPSKFVLTAYRYIFANPAQIMDSYQVTVLSSVLGTLLSVLVMALVAYPLSRSSFKYKRMITFFIFFTMLFGGGLIPSYILNTQYLKLGNTLWIYILPSLANAWYIIVIRTFLQSLPASLVESAKIDGAGELRIFWRIIVPLSKPVLATVALLTLLAKWNDWMNSMLYITEPKLFTLQYLLQKILREAEFIKSMANAATTSAYQYNLAQSLPSETARFAMVIVAAGPMLIVFPFFQKYFTRGLTVGSVKG